MKNEKIKEKNMKRKRISAGNKKESWVKKSSGEKNGVTREQLDNE